MRQMRRQDEFAFDQREDQRQDHDPRKPGQHLAQRVVDHQHRKEGRDGGQHAEDGGDSHTPAARRASVPVIGSLVPFAAFLEDAFADDHRVIDQDAQAR